MCIQTKLENLCARMNASHKVKAKERRKVDNMLERLRNGEPCEQEARNLLAVHRGLIN